MRHTALIGIGGAALLGLCACGGSSSQTPAAPIPPATASRMIGAFLLIESSPSAPAALPSWKASPGGGALQLVQGAAANGCTSLETAQNPDGSTTLKATFSCSSQADGTTLSGAIWFTFSASSPGNYTFEYKDLKLGKDTQSWTVNGTKHVALNLAQSRATLSTPTPMLMSFLDTTDPSASRTFSYGCNLVSDWAAVGNYRVWGAFSFQSGNAPAFSGTIPDLHPLTWMPGCCHPVSGMIMLAQGSAGSDVTFSSPCGSYTVSGIETFAPTILPACPN